MTRLAPAPATRFIGLAVFLLAFVLIEALELLARPYATDGFYFQKWPSETMLQTVPLQDLRDAPFVSLSNIHIQPPGFDAVRAALVAMRPSSDVSSAIRTVDATLYWLWAILYAVMALFLMTWLGSLVGQRAAAGFTALFMLHPATIFYASLLDTTFLSALLVLWMYYLLWRVRRRLPVSMVWLAMAFLALFFFRSIFQLPTVLVLIASLCAMKVAWRKVLLFTLIAGGVAGLYTLHQYQAFHLVSTSSFVGLNLNNSIGLEVPPFVPTLAADGAPSQPPGKMLPQVLARPYKFTNAVNYNNINYLEMNKQLTARYFEALRHMSLADLARAYWQNAGIYFAASSTYKPHAIVDRLPWRALYDAVFSFPILVLLLAVASGRWLYERFRHKELTAGLGLFLPGLYVFAVSILLERGENMRFKFFLEPVMYVFVVTQLSGSVRRLYNRIFSPARGTVQL